MSPYPKSTPRTPRTQPPTRIPRGVHKGQKKGRQADNMPVSKKQAQNPAQTETSPGKILDPLRVSCDVSGVPRILTKVNRLPSPPYQRCVRTEHIVNAPPK